MIVLANGQTILSLSIINNMLQAEEESEKLYSYFKINSKVIMDKITFGNLSEVLSVEFFIRDKKAFIKVLDGSNSELECSLLADEYNLRNGLYKDMLEVSCQSSMEDLYSYSIIHKNGDLLNNAPWNITRKYNRPNSCYPNNDYFSFLAKSLDYDFLDRYCLELDALIRMKLEFERYITRDFYNQKKNIYCNRPASWDFLLSLFGNESLINLKVDSNIRKCRNYKEPIIEKKNIKACLIQTAVSFTNMKPMCSEKFLLHLLSRKGIPTDVFKPSYDKTNNDYMYSITENKAKQLEGYNLFIFILNEVNISQSYMMGVLNGIWLARKRYANELFIKSKDQITEKELIYAAQDVPRIILFTSGKKHLPQSYTASSLAHIESYKHFEVVLDSLDFNYIEYLHKKDFTQQNKFNLICQKPSTSIGGSIFTNQ